MARYRPSCCLKEKARASFDCTPSDFWDFTKKAGSFARFCNNYSGFVIKYLLWNFRKHQQVAKQTIFLNKICLKQQIKHLKSIILGVVIYAK